MVPTLLRNVMHIVFMFFCNQDTFLPSSKNSSTRSIALLGSPTGVVSRSVFFWHISRYLIKHLNSIVYVAKCFQQKKNDFQWLLWDVCRVQYLCEFMQFLGMTYEYNILLINNPHPLPEPHRPKIHESLACRLDHTYPSSNRLPQAHGVTRCF